MQTRVQRIIVHNRALSKIVLSVFVIKYSVLNCIFQIDYFYFNHTQLSLMANGTCSESILVNLLFPVYSNVLSDFNYSQIPNH